MSDLGSANWSETDASNTATPPNGWPEGMNPSDVNNSARANMGGLKRWWDRSNSVKTTGGTTAAYTLTYDVAAASYYDGEEFSFIVNATCGDAPTLSINGVGARQIRKFTAGAFANLAASDVVANQPIRVRYNLGATTFDMLPGYATTATTAAAGTNTTDVATTAFVQAAVGKTYIQTFTATGTYTPHAGMVNCIIECIGGGGGGGGVANSATLYGEGGGGGGAGGRSILKATAATIGASKAVTIGAAGAAGASGNNAGGNGGDTSVSTLCIGKGGSGGAGGAGGSTTIAAGGLGGVAGTGDATGLGAPGESTGALYSSYGQGGAGGSSPYGGGGLKKITTSTGTGNAGTGYGAGGSGGASYNAGGAAAGAAGTAGFVIITEFCNQ